MQARRWCLGARLEGTVAPPALWRGFAYVFPALAGWANFLTRLRRCALEPVNPIADKTEEQTQDTAEGGSRGRLMSLTLRIFVLSPSAGILLSGVPHRSWIFARFRALG